MSTIPTITGSDPVAAANAAAKAEYDHLLHIIRNISSKKFTLSPGQLALLASLLCASLAHFNISLVTTVSTDTLVGLSTATGVPESVLEAIHKATGKTCQITCVFLPPALSGVDATHTKFALLRAAVACIGALVDGKEAVPAGFPINVSVIGILMTEHGIALHIDEIGDICQNGHQAFMNINIPSQHTAKIAAAIKTLTAPAPATFESAAAPATTTSAAAPATFESATYVAIEGASANLAMKLLPPTQAMSAEELDYRTRGLGLLRHLLKDLDHFDETYDFIMETKVRNEAKAAAAKAAAAAAKAAAAAAPTAAPTAAPMAAPADPEELKVFLEDALTALKVLSMFTAKIDTMPSASNSSASSSFPPAPPLTESNRRES